MPGQSHNRGPTSRQNELTGKESPKRHIPGQLKTKIMRGGRVVEVGEPLLARDRAIRPARGE